MPACVVLGCTSGYQTNKEKTHFFNVPKDPRALELWRKAIGPTKKPIKSGQSVCNKHFREKEILWKRELRGPDGALIGVSPYKIPRLVKGSTPSIFAPMECATQPESLVTLENVLHPGGDSEKAMDCSNIESFEIVPRIFENKEENTPVDPVDCTIAGPTESAVPTESTVATESSGRPESAVPTQNTVATESSVPTENAVSTQNTVATESSVPTESAVPTQNTVATESSVPTESAVPTQNTVATESSVPTESAVSTQNTVATESSVPTESAVPTQNTVATESSVPMENTVPMESHGENFHEPMVRLTIRELIELNQSPVPGWAKQNIRRDDGTSVVFSKAEFRRDSDALKTFPLKEIIITSDLGVHVNILNTPWSIADLEIEIGPALTLQQLQNLLLKLDELKVCTGSKLQTELSTIDCRIAKKDIGGTWRHVECSLLLTDETVCKFCQRVRKTAARKIRRTAIRGQPKRIHLRLSPTKSNKLSRLQHKSKNVKKATRRAKKSLCALKSELGACQEKLNSYSEKSLLDILDTTKLPKNQEHALKEIVAAAQAKDRKGRRYTEDWILLCMLLHMRSASGYNFLRDNNVIPLPCPRTIRRYLSKINTTCGFDDQFFKILKVALSKKEEVQKHGILLLDEMATRESISVNSKTLTYKGLVDFGMDSEQPPEFSDKANHALVIMFQPLFDDYAQPIAVFASRGPVKGHVLAQLIIKAIALLENVGARVHGVVTDGASTNRKFWTELGASGSRTNLKNYFEHPTCEDRRVFVFSDTPHLIKTIRNRLYNNKILQVDPGKPFIQWKHFEILHETDKALAGPGHILVCPKLTKHHLTLSNSQKMRVRLAVQVFSNSVATGLQFFQKHNDGLRDCESTAWFCDWIDKMFDALNRKQPVDGVEPGNHDFKVIQESIKTLDTWEENVEKGLISKDLFLTKQTAEGLRVTLQSTLDLVTYLTQHCGFTSVLTGRINQDPVEIFFGTVRQTGGCNDHPSTPTFLQIYKILSTYSVLKPPKTGNCSILDRTPSEPLVSLAELKSIYKTSDQSNLFASIKEKLTTAVQFDDWAFDNAIELEHDYCSPEITTCVMYYTTAALVKRIMNTVTCLTCKDSLLTTESNSTLPKACITDSLVKGPWLHPNEHLFRFVIFLEERFVAHRNSARVFESILHDVYNYEKLSFPCKEHADNVLLHIIQYYVLMRMQQYSARLNAEQKKSNLDKKKIAKHCTT